MKKKWLIRLVFSVLTLLIVSILSFMIIEFAPGSPISRYADNPKITSADRERIIRHLGLDKPTSVRYFIWLKNVLRGDFGLSYMTGRPVLTEILARLPATLKLMLFSFFISVAFAIPIGIYAAMRRNSLPDVLISFISYLGISLPSFWLGLLLIYIFAVKLQLLPAGGQLTPWFDSSAFPLPVRPAAVFWEHLRHLLLPAATLSFGNIARWCQYLRSSLLETINENYIRTARAKGLNSRTVVYKHALRNAITPLITVIGLNMPAFFAGAVITEQIFSWPGMGQLFITAVFARDYQVIMGITIITAAMVLLGNFLSDILYAVFDPRVEYRG
jgi:peptide/nickel transport system permease protein